MTPVTYPNDRIAFQVCVDAIPAFAADTLSLKPFTWMNLSLSPTIRAKTRHMLLMMLLPAKLKMGQKKYYDFAAKYELNRLFEEGIDGIKVKVFGCSMDTKGREELLGELSKLSLVSLSLTCVEQACKRVRHTKAVGCAPTRGVPATWWGGALVYMMVFGCFWRRDVTRVVRPSDTRERPISSG